MESQRTTIRMPLEVHARLRHASYRDGVSENQIMLDGLLAELDRRDSCQEGALSSSAGESNA